MHNKFAVTKINALQLCLRLRYHLAKERSFDSNLYHSLRYKLSEYLPSTWFPSLHPKIEFMAWIHLRHSLCPLCEKMVCTFSFNVITNFVLTILMVCAVGDAGRRIGQNVAITTSVRIRHWNCLCSGSLTVFLFSLSLCQWMDSMRREWLSNMSRQPL